MKLFNTLTRKQEDFTPQDPPNVKMYSCGPTVYDFAHIGHLRRYVGDDVIKKSLKRLGYMVEHVMNITDVGHLTSDADEGEDKLEKGARKHGKTVWEVAKFFEEDFFNSTDQLNIERPSVICRATEHIEEQIKLISKLEENGFIYKTPEGVYFDTSKFPNYTKLSGQSLESMKTGVREDVNVDPNKKNTPDFALWIFTKGRFENHTMRWNSPWGEGFPGWHIECSAMSMKYLGDTLDIHTGGIDHIPIHHTNEIAQSEAATGKKFVKYFIHHAFLQVDGTKMSKSLGNLYTIKDIAAKGINPLALRYLYLTAHYRDPLNFTWESLNGANAALMRLYSLTQNFLEEKDTERNSLSSEKLSKIDEYVQEFNDSLSDDFNTAKALSVMWEAVKSNIPNRDKYDLLISFDEVLGLGINTLKIKVSETIKVTQNHTIITPIPLSKETVDRIEDRYLAKAKGDFEKSDSIRKLIQKKDKIDLQDTPRGTVVVPIATTNEKSSN